MEQQSIYENKTMIDEESTGSHDENEGEDAHSNATGGEREPLLRNPIVSFSGFPSLLSTLTVASRES